MYLRGSCQHVRVTSWQPGWADFPPALLEFWTERHLCTLTTLRADGRPHVVPVGVALDLEQRCAWVITSGTSHKAHQAAADPRVAACQVDGARWSTIEGTAEVLRDETSVQRAMDRYAARYRTPRPNPLRVALRIEVDRFLVSRGLV
jgi:PPOX class probable F420-dependent enzyme